MKRRTLDIVFSVGGLALAVLLGVLGLVLRSNANFAKDYVHDQLVAQKITFTPADKLSPEEKQSSDLVKYGGQPLSTGKQAEVYANDYIALHLAETNEGKTYAQTSTAARALRADATKAQAATFEGGVMPVRDLQRRYAAWALEQLGGHRTRTAERLGIDAKTLAKWLSDGDGTGET